MFRVNAKRAAEDERSVTLVMLKMLDWVLVPETIQSPLILPRILMAWPLMGISHARLYPAAVFGRAVTFMLKLEATVANPAEIIADVTSTVVAEEEGVRANLKVYPTWLNL